MSDPAKPPTILCHCKCPFWGVHHDSVYCCQCDCGKEVFVCGHCLKAGRRTACDDCAKKELRTGGGPN